MSIPRPEKQASSVSLVNDDACKRAPMAFSHDMWKSTHYTPHEAISSSQELIPSFNDELYLRTPAAASMANSQWWHLEHPMQPLDFVSQDFPYHQHTATRSDTETNCDHEPSGVWTDLFILDSAEQSSEQESSDWLVGCKYGEISDDDSSTNDAANEQQPEHASHVTLSGMHASSHANTLIHAHGSTVVVCATQQSKKSDDSTMLKDPPFHEVSNDNGSKYTSARRQKQINRPKHNHPREAKEILQAWFYSHLHATGRPYPSNDVKEELVVQTGLTLKQITNFYINERKRSKDRIFAGRSTLNAPKHPSFASSPACRVEATVARTK
jgi:hypothetical protein